MKITAFVTLAMLTVPALAAAAPGFVRMEDRGREDRPLELSVWYPSGQAATDEIGGNAVFQGTAAAVDAEFSGGALPLVVLSHGGLRSAGDSGAWLAALMAESGLVVVEVGAPRPGGAAEAVAEIAKRPGDISRAVDAMLAHPDWADRVDPVRVSVVGFALGGTAALAVAGADVDTGAIAGACALGGIGGPDCGWLAEHGLSLSGIDAMELKMARDGRAGAAVAIAPEYVGALGAADVATLVLAPDDDQAMFDAFPLCTERGSKIIAYEGGDAALCGGSPEGRNAAHEAIAGAVVDFLADAWD